jgi:hypothetical protein
MAFEAKLLSNLVLRVSLYDPVLEVSVYQESVLRVTEGKRSLEFKLFLSQQLKKIK